MPPRDFFHEAVRQALIKDGWMITDDPLFVPVARVDLAHDPGGKQVIAAEKAGQRIAVVINHFSSVPPLPDFHRALGQCMNYRLALEMNELEHKLYMAVPQDVYATFFALPFIQLTLEDTTPSLTSGKQQHHFDTAYPNCLITQYSL